MSFYINGHEIMLIKVQLSIDWDYNKLFQRTIQNGDGRTYGKLRIPEFCLLKYKRYALVILQHIIRFV